MNTPEIEELKLLIEQKYGKTLGTTTDFEEFSVHLSHDTGQNVSASTLKRLWGYVNDSHKPRMFTLDILAQYLGHANSITPLFRGSRQAHATTRRSSTPSSSSATSSMPELRWR